MHLGIDIDGVLSAHSPIQGSYTKGRMLFRLNQILPGNIGGYWLKHHTSVRTDIALARELASRHTVSIITARPIVFHRPTEQWLVEKARISYQGLYCVGLTPEVPQRKYEYAKEVGVEVFIDDTSEIVSYFQEQGMDAHQFVSWDRAWEYIEGETNNV